MEGYKQAIQDVEKALNDAIYRNNGARTTQGVINVFNEMVTFLHRKNLELNEPEQEPQVYVFLGGL